jgi:LEA14-like dessication related protein
MARARSCLQGVDGIIRRAMISLRRMTIALLLPITAIAGLPPDFEPPTVELDGMRVIEMTASRQTLGLTLRVHNPNMFDIPLHSLRYELLINGERLAHGDRKEPVTLPGGGDERVEVRAVVSVQQVLDHLMTLAQRGEFATDYRLRGEFRVGNGNVAIPYDQKGRIDLHDLLPIEREAPPPKPTVI